MRLRVCWFGGLEVEVEAEAEDSLGMVLVEALESVGVLSDVVWGCLME